MLQLTSGTGVKLLLDIKESPALDKRKVVRLGVNGILSDLPEVMNTMLAGMRKARSF